MSYNFFEQTTTKQLVDDALTGPFSHNRPTRFADRRHTDPSPGGKHWKILSIYNNIYEILGNINTYIRAIGGTAQHYHVKINNCCY